uniref:Nucleosome assembly protein 1-like 4 n=1 Tax=Clastoptera arizonana TaxID=38151 RepID=A0A1B6DHR9_9HEMI
MSKEPERLGDASEDIEDMEDEEDNVDDIKKQILRQPELLAALQSRFHAQMLQSLPAPVKRRIKALKKIQLEATHIEAKFYEEIHELEAKYHLKYLPLYEKRSNVVNGQYEPNDEECDFSSDDEKDDELSNEMKTKVKIEDVTETKEQTEEEKNKANVKGIPDFWLTIFKNVGMLTEMVQEHDEPILKHLLDIRVIFLYSNPMGFVLEFHFSNNDYFSNSVLTKEYEMKCVPDESDPFSFEGPEIYKCKGCIIDWKKGKNVTLKTVKKKQKHKSKGSVRTVVKTVQNDSFFNFFSPPSMPDDPDTEVDDDTQALLTADFEIGHYIRERIVPKAVLYYTGEALEDEEDFDEEEDGEEEEELDDESDPDYNPNNPKSRKAAAKTANPAECQQQ